MLTVKSMPNSNMKHTKLIAVLLSVADVAQNIRGLSYMLELTLQLMLSTAVTRRLANASKLAGYNYPKRRHKNTKESQE